MCKTIIHHCRFLMAYYLESTRITCLRWRMRMRPSPYHVEVQSPPSSMQHLTFVQVLASASPTRTSSNTPHGHEPNELQLVASINPIRNTCVGEPFSHTPAPPQPSPDKTGPLVHQTRLSLSTSHCSPRSRSPLIPSTQPAGPIPTHRIAMRMMFRPKGIAKKGLKQSMGLHDSEERRNAYNRFRVSSLYSHSFSFTYSSCFRNVFRSL